MEELTLRLPAETKESLQTEASVRGLSLGEHIRDIIDSYQGRGSPKTRPVYDIEYDHSVNRGGIESTEDGGDTDGESETIGSFSYGSRSILS